MTHVLAAGNGFADTVTGAVSDYAPDMALVGASAIGVGVAIWGLRKGWGYFKSLSH